jgi:hypothetical protein
VFLFGAIRGRHGGLKVDHELLYFGADGFRHKPVTTFGTMNSDVLERTLPGYRRPNFCDRIAANPLGG